MQRSILPLVALGAVIVSSPALAMVDFTISLESEVAGAQNSSSGFFSVGVEDFNSRTPGLNQSFNTDFGGSIFRGRYTGVQVLPADQYGGAGGGGAYPVTFSEAGYSLDLSSTQPGGVTYFGFWLPALDGGNQVTFFSGGQQLFTFSAADAGAFIGGLPDSSTYLCNPNGTFAGQNCGEPYAFLNFYARGNARFDRVVFAQVPAGGGYESDNHTVGRWSRISGTVIAGAGVVPEPESWALLIAGFGMVGAAARRRRSQSGRGSVPA